MQLQSTHNVGINGIKSLVYGGPGKGKTTSLATAPSPVIISAESGLLSLRRLPIALPFIEVKDFRGLTDAYTWAANSAEAKQFGTLCVDSISEIAEVVLASEKARTKDPRKAYGELLDLVVGLTRAFRDIPNKNVIIVAKEEYDKDETTGSMLYQPSMPGKKLGPALPYYFDEVFQAIVGKDTTTQKEWYAFRTKAAFNIIAKDRSGMLDEYEQPNFTHIFNKILATNKPHGA